MRAVACGSFMLMLGLLAQVAPQPQPEWLITLQKAQQEVYEAPLGSLDAQVEQAWQAALQAPSHPQFQTAAQMTSSFFQSQGYDLKAEHILRQALGRVSDPQTRRMLNSQLAGLFENAQQFTKAMAIREAQAKEPSAGIEGSTPLSTDAVALANLYERMGELEKAEAALKDAMRLRAAESQRTASGATGAVMIGGSFVRPGMGNRPGARFLLGNRAASHNDLAGFYARHGRSADAEQLHKEAMADTGRGGATQEWSGAAQTYIQFLTQQHRFDEAIALTRDVIARTEASSDPNVTQMAFYQRQSLSNLLLQAGHADQGLASQKQNVQAAQAHRSGSPEHVQALSSLAQTLINQNRLEEAEATVAQMREAGKADSRNGQFHESMAVQTLARIRDMQHRPEEAQRLRASVGVPDVTAGSRPPTVHDRVNSSHEVFRRGDVDAALALADKALVIAAERVRTNPQEAASAIHMVNGFMGKEREADARRIALSTLQILEQASPPDHPRIAGALASVVSPLASIGMTVEAEQIIERQEKILIRAKGPESPSLDSASHGRIELMQRASNFSGALDERKRMLARTEKATGPRSIHSLNALREVAWAYPALNNWGEEERVLMALLERTVHLSGESSMDHGHLLVHIANRASQNRQFDQALASMDRAIQVIGSLPEAAGQLPGMVQNREQIVRAKNAPPGQPVDSRWFNGTGGAGMGVIGVAIRDQPLQPGMGIEVRGAIANHPAVIRRVPVPAGKTQGEVLPAPAPVRP